jgi:ribosome modulation factor
MHPFIRSITFTPASPIAAIPGKVSNKTLHMQGWNAARAGYAITQCPYYASSTAERHWLAGFRSV